MTARGDSAGTGSGSGVLDEGQVDLLFHALSDRTRRDIMSKVSESEQSISDLARQYEVSFAAIQKHVSVLERAELVTKTEQGRRKLVHNNPDTLRRAAELLARYEQVWTQRINAIEQILDQKSEGR
ncbi:MAG: winged helix-turn-helix transcriptional regulator [Solirubrobacterales bacterium]|nr:winged helix-turn-helix transcriptional regulator [Solirubrobacterales bacterium]